MAAWAAARPAGSSPAEALAWLQAQGLQDAVIEAILPVLQGLWAQAWDAGWKAGEETAAIEALLDQQQRRNRIVAMGFIWATQIAATTLLILAGYLAAAGGMAVDAMTRGAKKALRDDARGRTIAQTEVTRLMSEGAAGLYNAGNVLQVKWLTEPPDPCEACIANREASKNGWPIGVPFPSGALYPPDHPNCRCAVVPA